MPTDELIEDACRVMHDAYERAAKSTGWETQKSSRVIWDDVPEANKATMRVAVAAVYAHWSKSNGHFREEVDIYRNAVNAEEQVEYHKDQS